MSEALFRDNKLRNSLQTGLILAGMTALLAVMGFALAGTVGLWLVTFLGLGYLLFTPNAGPEMAMRMARAQKVGYYEAPRLMQMLEALARRAQLPAVPDLYYIPSPALNALAAGSPNRSAIAVTHGLLRTLDSREVLGVLAHEMTHLQNNDLKVMALAGTANQMTNSFATLGQLLLLLNLPLYLLGQAPVPWLFVLVLLVAPLMSTALQLALSRTREFDADLGAAKLTGDPRGLASALNKLDRFQGGIFERFLFPVRRRPEVPAWLRTHPDTGSRIKRLLSYEPEREPIAVAPIGFQPRMAQPRRFGFRFF